MICLTVLRIGHKGYKYEFTWHYTKSIKTKDETEYPKQDEIKEEEIEETLMDVVDEKMKSYFKEVK